MIPRHLLIALALLLIAIFGMGFYALHLRSVAETHQQRLQDLRPVPPPVAGPAQRVTLFVADDSDGLLHQREVAVALPPDPGQRAREILRALVAKYLEKPSPHPLAEGADIKDVFLVNGNTAVIDATAAFADGHRSGITVEELTLASLAQTLAANLPGVTRIKLLVDGKERETLAGHADLMSFYSVTSAASLVAK
jgi:hypothetical protein